MPGGEASSWGCSVVGQYIRATPRALARTRFGGRKPLRGLRGPSPLLWRTPYLANISTAAPEAHGHAQGGSTHLGSSLLGPWSGRRPFFGQPPGWQGASLCPPSAHGWPHIEVGRAVAERSRFGGRKPLRPLRGAEPPLTAFFGVWNCLGFRVSVLFGF